MTARQHIAALLDEWLKLTHRECQAIQDSDWAQLTRCQTAKAALRAPLHQALQDWNTQADAREAAEKREPFYRQTIERLQLLEQQNAELLMTRKQTLLDRKRAVEQAARNLRLVRDSYARGGVTAWQAYS